MLRIIYESRRMWQGTNLNSKKAMFVHLTVPCTYFNFCFRNITLLFCTSSLVLQQSPYQILLSLDNSAGEEVPSYAAKVLQTRDPSPHSFRRAQFIISETEDNQKKKTTNSEKCKSWAIDPLISFSFQLLFYIKGSSNKHILQEGFQISTQWNLANGANFKTIISGLGWNSRHERWRSFVSDFFSSAKYPPDTHNCIYKTKHTHSRHNEKGEM